MDFVDGIAGMNFSPVSNYNNFLKSTAALDVDSGSDFENILNSQTNALKNPVQIQGGVELNKFSDVVAQQSVQSVGEPEGSTGKFLNSFSNSINKGLGSVNASVKAADKAQEAMAMGENVSVHDVMISAEKASLNMQMALQLRNKLLSAYSEINNVRV